MRRPGFAQLHYDSATRTASVVRKSFVANKKAPSGMAYGKQHGQILDEIYDEASRYIDNMDILVFASEAAFAKFSRDTAAINKAHGLMDWLLWHYRGMVHQELAATSIKKLVAGNGKATKEEVEAALEQFVGKQWYEVDDESDAVAVAIAWLIDNGYIDSPYDKEGTECLT